MLSALILLIFNFVMFRNSEVTYSCHAGNSTRAQRYCQAFYWKFFLNFYLLRCGCFYSTLILSIFHILPIFSSRATGRKPKSFLLLFSVPVNLWPVAILLVFFFFFWFCSLFMSVLLFCCRVKVFCFMARNLHRIIELN